MKNRVKEILKELLEIKDELNLNISHEVLFAESCSIYRGEEAGKKTKSYTSRSSPTPNPASLATEKQINYLAKHNIDHNAETLTKEEAKVVIGEHIKSLEKKK